MRAYEAPSTQALRGWQRRALVKYLAARPKDFLAVATPGAGKTTFALRIAAELLADGIVKQVTVVVPTEHLKPSGPRQPPGSASRSTPTSATPTGHTPPIQRHRWSPTRRWPATRCCTGPARRTASTLVILDEVHHAGDAQLWGDGVRRPSTPPRAGSR